MTKHKRQELERYLLSRGDVGFAVLFGSAAAGRETEESDVDVALYLRPPDPGSSLLEIEGESVFPQEEELWAAIEHIVGREVDLLILNRAPASVAASAIGEGRLLAVNDHDLYRRYAVAVTTEAEEFRDFLEDFIRVRRRSRSLSAGDRERLLRIAQYLRDELADAELYVNADRRRYMEDAHFRRALERWVENLVNASIDVGKIVVASRNLAIPQTYRETMAALEAVDEFSSLAGELARNTRTRNALAHEYLDIRYSEVSRVAAEAAGLYGKLAEAVDAFLARETEGSDQKPL